MSLQNNREILMLVTLLMICRVCPTRVDNHSKINIIYIKKVFYIGYIIIIYIYV